MTAPSFKDHIPAGLMQRLRSVRRWRAEARNPILRRDRIDNINMALLLAFGLTTDTNCIDVGANVGTVLEQFVRLAPRGKHIAFEPIPGCARKLRELYPEVDVQEIALSDHDGESTFVHAISHPYLSGLQQRPTSETLVTEKLTVRTAKLDEVLAAGYRPDLIKIDVEGAEGLVLAGALQTLVEYRPTVIFEHARTAAAVYGTTAADVYDMLVAKARLRIFDLDGAGPYSLADFAEATADDMQWNWVAHR